MMKQQFSNLRNLLILPALALPMLAMAGNIPQYKVTKGGTPYSEITGGTTLPMSFNGNAVLFGDGTMSADTEVSRDGYPIGFTFFFGGRYFDNFAVDNYGNIYLGNGKVNVGTDAFRIGMSTVMYGLYKADVSYITEGTAGNRVLTVQYKNATLNETSKNRGIYNLQIRLYEANGNVEMAFNETETCYDGGGFATGLRGWDNDDTLWLTATGLDKTWSISPKKNPDMLEADSFIKWDKDDYDNGYSPVFLFSPDLNRTAPTDAPQDLTLKQNGSRLLVTCRKGEDADATAVLISETPFTDADLPADGHTFRAGRDSQTGEWYTRIGASTLLYYGNDGDISVEVPGLTAGKDYYVCAISATGFPAYNRTGRAEQILSSSQAGPESIDVTAAGPSEMRVDCRASYPVIIASTTEGEAAYGAGYTGVFGTPTADAKVGDELEGGGTVIYVGDPGAFVTEAEPNRLVYFRGWTLKGDNVSATYADGKGVPAVSFPYEPVIESYPLGSPLHLWEGTEGEFVPVTRAYEGDRAVLATSDLDTELTLTTPVFTSDRDMTLSFEYAMETEKEAAVGEEGQMMMQGFEPGCFDETGYFHVRSGETVLKEINEYGGTMRSSSGGNEDGSSSFEPVEVAVPAKGEPQTVSLHFSTPRKSRLYLRNLRIAQTGEPLQTGIGEIGTGETDLSSAVIHSITGVRVQAGSIGDLPAGVYIVNGKKVIVGR
ncbi:MAG: hypothetical protein HDS28_01575 [Bacteroides sp.]|nr:hypothetical protein [Bacteroides sp.]